MISTIPNQWHLYEKSARRLRLTTQAAKVFPRSCITGQLCCPSFCLRLWRSSF
jgi:hypothetical protein